MSTRYDERCPICHERMAIEYHHYPLYSREGPLNDEYAHYVCTNPECDAYIDEDDE